MKRFRPASGPQKVEEGGASYSTFTDGASSGDDADADGGSGGGGDDDDDDDDDDFETLSGRPVPRKVGKRPERHHQSPHAGRSQLLTGVLAVGTFTDGSDDEDDDSDDFEGGSGRNENEDGDDDDAAAAAADDADDDAAHIDAHGIAEDRDDREDEDNQGKMVYSIHSKSRGCGTAEESKKRMYPVVPPAPSFRLVAETSSDESSVDEEDNYERHHKSSEAKDSDDEDVVFLETRSATASPKAACGCSGAVTTSATTSCCASKAGGEDPWGFLRPPEAQGPRISEAAATTDIQSSGNSGSGGGGGGGSDGGSGMFGARKAEAAPPQKKNRSKCTPEEKDDLAAARRRGCSVTFVQTNPKRPGKSRDRYEAYKFASSIEEAISKKGATMSDIQNDWLRGYLHVQGLASRKQVGGVASEASAPAKKAKKNGTSGSNYRGKNELRRERNERRAKFREGEALLPPPVVRFDTSVRIAATIRHSTEPKLFFTERVPIECDPSPDGAPSSERTSEGSGKRPLGNSTNTPDSNVMAANKAISTVDDQVSLAFRMPVAPSRPQLVTMKAAVRAISHNAIGFLESPTGTGKTLGLLAAALECQQVIEGHVAREKAQLRASRMAHGQEEEDEPDQHGAPRVVWVARTHDQLEHAVHEFKRLPYRPMMSLRLSRERYCAHPDVAVAPNRAEACEEATKINGPGCTILDNAERIRYPQAPHHIRKYQGKGGMAVYDIEEAVREGEATHTCPFHTSQDLVQEGAGLIFITYTQLLEPSVRSSGGFGPIFKNAIIVIDEGHNVPSVSREAGTLRTDAAALRKIVDDLNTLQGQLLNEIGPDGRNLPVKSTSVKEGGEGDVHAMKAKKKVRPSVKSPFLQAGSAHTNADAAKTAGDFIDLLRMLVAWLDRCEGAPVASLAKGPPALECSDSSVLEQSAGIEPSPPFHPLNLEKLPNSDSWEKHDTWSGDGGDALRLVTEVMGLSSVKVISTKIEALKKLRKGLIDIGLESTAVRSSTINDVEAILWRLLLVLQTRGEDFQLLLKRKESTTFKTRAPPKRGGRGGRGGWGSSKSGGRGAQRDSSPRDAEWHLDVVCLRAAHPFAFATSEAKSVLLASGTLGPFDSLAQELGVTLSDSTAVTTKSRACAGKRGAIVNSPRTLPTDMDLASSSDVIWNGGARVCVAPPEPRTCIVSSADHHRGIERMVLRVVVPEYNRMKLRLTQRNQSDPACLDNLGGAILQCARSIPNGGVLVFFPSYKMLEAWYERSSSNGCLAAFEQSKRVFVERKSLSGDDFQHVIDSYKAQAGKSVSSSSVVGAVFFAVMRGRASEGCDFRDFAARAVIVVGVPYPSLNTETKLIKAHRDAVAGKGAGDLWYEAEAYRQVSQAAGRLIRHQMDYGVLFSIDQRYTTPSSTLAPWIVQDRIMAGPDLFDRVSGFFEDRCSLAAERANQSLVVHAPLFKKSAAGRGDIRNESHSSVLASSPATTSRCAVSSGSTEPAEAPHRPSDLTSAEF